MFKKCLIAIIALSFASFTAKASNNISYDELLTTAKADGAAATIETMRQVVTTQKKYMKMGNVLVERVNGTRTEMTFANFGLKARLIVQYQSQAGESFVSYVEFKRNSKWQKFTEVK